MVDDVLHHLTGENHIPVIRFSLDRAGLHLTHRRASFLACGELDFDGANFRETHSIILGERKTQLWKSKGVVAPVALEARIAWPLPRFDATKEIIESFHYPPKDIL